MPLKTNVGISRKIADNNYGSRGASVNLEVELDTNLIQEPERFQDRIRQVFRLAQQAIDDELDRQQGNCTSNGSTHGQCAQPSHNGGNGHGATNGHANGTNGNGSNGHRNGSNGNGGYAATTKQLDYASQLAKSIHGLGARKLESLATKMFGKPLAALTSMDASGLIDTLKKVKDGSISLDNVLEGTSP
jgi:hypothetical protein